MDYMEKLERVIAESEEIKKRNVGAAINWYQRHAKLPRILFRASGYSLIIFSVSLPFLVSTDFRGSNLAASVVSLLVAALAGITSFTQWDSQWRGYKRAQFALESLQAEWEIKVLEARHMESPEEALGVVLEATRELIQSAKAIVASETEQFFEVVRPPQLPK